MIEIEKTDKERTQEIKKRQTGRNEVDDELKDKKSPWKHQECGYTTIANRSLILSYSTTALHVLSVHTQPEQLNTESGSVTYISYNANSLNRSSFALGNFTETTSQQEWLGKQRA